MNNLKILLMVPVTSLIKHVPRFPDLGIGYLAFALRKSGYDTTIRSWNMDPSAENFKRYIHENKFDVIGIKVFTKDVSAANTTMQMIRSVSPDSVIVVGGPHPSTSQPEDTMKDFPDCDFVFRGEGETGFPLFMEHIEKHDRNCLDGLTEIPGLVWKNDHSVLWNAPVFASRIDDFGMPSWELMNPQEYKTPRIPGGQRGGYSAPLIVTRGCSSRCIYCAAHKINGKTIRSRSPESVIEEIRLLYHKHNVRHLFIMDTRFTHNEDIVNEISEGLLRNSLDVAWDCIGYEDLSSLTENTLKLMKRSGCKLINIGIESGSDSVRKRIRKQGTTKEILERIQVVRNAGINIRTYFMIGFPGETRREIQETVHFAFSLPTESVQFEIACPHPGTELYDYLKQKYSIKKVDWGKFDVYRSPYPLSELNSVELYTLLKKIRRRCSLMQIKGKITALWK